MHTVIETPTFLRRAVEAGMTDAERFDLVSHLGAEPDAGDLIPGTGGVRKLRFAGKGKGKSGGFRAITFYHSAALPVFLVTVCAKNTKIDLTKGERNALAKLTGQLVQTYRGKFATVAHREG